MVMLPCHCLLLLELLLPLLAIAAIESLPGFEPVPLELAQVATIDYLFLMLCVLF